ncbi:G2/mitotic-specific cyclin-1-like isoform X3 [Camellia sinensis]|uniref:G2/mitotic-specific cyclin-1-like isoform X3 n=1 Tax=Camellia sinensis TaxID=4442 RepID=UPI0010368748|nr:G2/mitotic-specific cyclin-1-like isoform X3 [Camellia sinensis]
MVISDENKNNPTLIKPINLQEMGSRKFGVEIRPNRGALSMINQNVARAHPYPCVVNKKVLSGKFAAQIASTQQHCLEKTKKPDSSSVQSFRVWEDCPVIDEEHKEATDPPVPMSLEQTEAVPDEEEQMEVEMEDIFEEPVMDIDSCDAKNPLAVVDYVHDVYVYYRKMEVN